MTTVSEVKTSPADVGPEIAAADRNGESEKSDEKFVTDEEKSDGEGSVIDADAVEDRGESCCTVFDQ
jgi:hypothetical protein